MSAPNLRCERKPENEPRCMKFAKVMVNFRDPATQKSPILIYCRAHADEAVKRLEAAGVEHVTLALRGVHHAS